MRELNKQDMIDLLYGCAVLGTGGVPEAAKADPCR